MRYAIYFAPRESSALWRAGCHWLGRDAISGAELHQPAVPDMQAETVRELTASPRRYGFHATLKPPFRLVNGSSQSDLLDAVADVANRRKPFPLPELEVNRLGSFLGLQITEPCEPLEELAAACVSELDRFRAPDSAEALARRSIGLDRCQRAHLARWGYPYVMDQWRFHMTLTNTLLEPQSDLLKHYLNDWFAAALVEPVWVQDLCVYVEPEPGGQFNVLARFPLKG
jgi:putative phosphonate metabolism protein